MQLTGIRIPDSAIQSIDSSVSLLQHLIVKPKPQRLAQILVEGYEPTSQKHNKKIAQLLLQGLQSTGSNTKLYQQAAPLLEQGKLPKTAPRFANLPNVKVVPTKYVPAMTETALGRQKIIERQLDEYGIPVPFREEMEKITAYEEQMLRRQIDAMTENDVESGAVAG